jgi:hypothetical protein
MNNETQMQLTATCKCCLVHSSEEGVWGNSYPLKSSSTKGLFGSIEFFYKNWFLALAHKIWFLKKTGWGVWRPISKS